MESGIGSGFGLDETAPVGDVSAGQNQVSPNPGEREERQRRQEPEKPSTNPAADGVAPADTAEKASEAEGERPPHRIDSLA